MPSLKVLFVDDSDLDVMLAVRALRAAGYAVTHRRVERAEQMAEALAAGDWDIVICDHLMPEFDALSALRLHRARDGDTPFVIVSGAMPDELAIDAMREGARDFINKNSLGRLAPAVERELANGRDRALLRQMQASIERLLFADTLTGVGNQDALFQRLGEQLGDASPLALVLIDLDRFRRLSQSLGLVAANRVLRVTATRLGALAEPRGGFVARVSGDRFALLLRGDGESLRGLGDEIRAALGAPIQLDGRALKISAALGAALAPSHAQQVERLLQAAEAALDEGKRVGDGALVLFRPGMRPENTHPTVLEQSLLRAVERGEFELFYHPEVTLADGAPSGLEALLRWNSPEHGLLLPGDFVPLLEDSGLIVAVGNWVIGEALRQLRRWRDSGVDAALRGGRLSINLSAAQFRQAEFVATVGRLLAETGVPGSAVELEITEAVAMGNEEQTIATLSALKALGLAIAIDDFGAGYSSLSYLQHFPVDRLKLDPSFARGEIAAGGGAVGALVAMGHGLRLGTSAEGIETATQVERLRAAGCLRGQGFLFARPMAAEATADYLRRWS